MTHGGLQCMVDGRGDVLLGQFFSLAIDLFASSQLRALASSLLEPSHFFVITFVTHFSDNLNLASTSDKVHTCRNNTLLGMRLTRTIFEE